MKELVFYGDDAFFYDFPEQTEIIYANKPIAPLENDKLAITNSIDKPIGSKPLEELINKDSRIAICFDDVSIPLPAMKNDVRGTAAEVIVKKLITLGVKKQNIQFICATGLHRKIKPKEFVHILGKEIYREYKAQISNHDASDKENLKILGKTSQGHEIELNKIAAEADLIIYLCIAFTPLNGGWKSIIVGLGTYNSIITHHAPEILKEGPFMDPKASKMHDIIWEMGRTIKDKINVFTIELALNNDFFSGIFDKIYSPLGGNKEKIPLWRRILLSMLKIMPRSLKSKLSQNIKAGYKLIGVYSGDIEKAHEQSLEKVREQMIVPVDKQYDVIIYGAPNVTPYNVKAVMNPLLLRTLLFGYLYNMHAGKSPLKKDGVIIISNPAYKKFDSKQHPSYEDLFNEVLTTKPDIFNIKDIEKKYLENPVYLEKYRNNYAYHGTHALMVYYWGTLGHVNVGKVIVAGAKSKKTIDILGYDYAKNLDEAIDICKRSLGEDCSIAYLCMPPLFITKI